MIYLLDRYQIISHSVSKSEIHTALSEIAKFISLSIFIEDLAHDLSESLNAHTYGISYAHNSYRCAQKMSMKIATI